MKRPRLLLFATLALSSFVHASSPQLGIVEAATKAQDYLQSLALGQDFYIRSLTLQPGTETNPEQIYVARFEPPKPLQLDAEGKPIVEKNDYLSKPSGYPIADFNRGFHRGSQYGNLPLK